MPIADEILDTLKKQKTFFEERWNLPWYQDRESQPIWRHRSLHQLAQIPDPEFGTVIGNLLRDPSFALKGIGLHLARMRRARDLAPKIRPLLRDASVHVRALAGAALASFSEVAPEPDLVTMRTDDHPEVKKAVIPGLLHVRTPESFALLLALAAKKGEDETVRCRAIGILGELAAAEARPTLSSILADSEEADEVRSEAALALGRIGGDDAQGALLAALADSRPWVRGRSAIGLATLKGEGAVDFCLDLVRPSEAWMTRMLAVQALGITRSRRALNALVGAAKDPEPRIRAEACAALAFLRDDQALRALKAALDDADILVRLQALSGLQAIAGKSFGFDVSEHRGQLDLKKAEAALAAARAWAVDH